jgi:phosphocarrier protein
MSHDPSVVRRQVEITNELGLHFRPAQKFVQLASQFQSEIRVHYHGKESNAKSFLDLTLLAAECGTQLDLVARGPDAEEAVEALVRLVVSRFDEGDDSQEKESSP